MVQQVIYIDMLFITNAVTGYFLLRAALAISAAKTQTARLMVGFVLSGISSFIILAGDLPPVLLWTYKIFTALVICAVCCKSKSIRMYAKVVGWYIGLNFALAGVVFGAIYYFAPSGIVYQNMTVYFNISPLMLLLCSACVYVAATILSRFFAKPGESVIANVSFVIFDKRVECKALVDSGFLIKDALCGNEIIMLSLPMLKACLPQEAITAAQSYFSGEYAPYGVYPVCVKTVSGEKVLPCIKILNVQIFIGKKSINITKCAAAFSCEVLSTGEFDGIISVKAAGELL